MFAPLLADVMSSPLAGPLVFVALAFVGATVVVRLKKKPSLPPAKPVEKPVTIELPQPAPKVAVVDTTLSEAEQKAAAERHAREQKAREEQAQAEAKAAAAKQALESATDEKSRAAAQAEVDRLAREADEKKRKADYEARKAAEADEKKQKALDAEARATAEAQAKLDAEAKAREEKAREQAARQKLVEQESGRTLSEGLAKTRGGFMARLNALLGTGKALDEAALGELEEILFSADVGVKTATTLLESVRERLKRKELADLSKVKAALREEIERILGLGAAPGAAGHGGLPALAAGVAGPQVVMIVGVNGVGKTTTIGKLASKLTASGKKVLLGAGDTFRAAAGEQLDVWADRAGVAIVRGKDGGDPGAVLFDSVSKGKNEGFDIVL
ncbi:MAG: signal recognition particle receptor subunit alpha, partial [Deltaproteobacteria bacterium]|nr:signal recognition particle receptor subunit alpha [Deltaproteobacteria bacterium]